MTEEKNTNEVYDEAEELYESVQEELAEGDDPNVDDADQLALDMETKNQQFEEDTEKALELLRNGDYFDTRTLLLSYNEVDIADIFEEILDELGIEKAIIAFRMLPKNVAVEVFSYLPGDDQVSILNAGILCGLLRLPDTLRPELSQLCAHARQTERRRVAVGRFAVPHQIYRH